jgi:hypothetical protein
MTKGRTKTTHKDRTDVDLNAQTNSVQKQHSRKRKNGDGPHLAIDFVCAYLQYRVLAVRFGTYFPEQLADVLDGF